MRGTIRVSAIGRLIGIGVFCAGLLPIGLAVPAMAQSGHASIPVWQGATANNDAAIALNNQGYAYARLGYYLPAIQAYNEALALAPTWASPYANRAMAYRQIGEAEKALADVVQSIEMDQNMVRNWQEWLTRLGFYQGEVDGLDGPMTQQAITAWAGVNAAAPQPAAATQ